MCSFKGTNLRDIYKGLGEWGFEVLPVAPSKHHSVLYELPVCGDEPPRPRVPQQTFHWNDGYLRMPYSEKNLYPGRDKNSRDTLISRWELIKESLSKSIRSVNEFEVALNRYNSSLPRFTALRVLFEEELSEEETSVFFERLLPKIIELALRLPEILPGNVPLLQTNRCKSISLSQLQAASLLANCFLCTIPWKRDVLQSYPGANFASLFSAHCRDESDGYVIEKLKCIMHYFRRVCDKVPTGVITFERKWILRRNATRWDKAPVNLGNTRVHVNSDGTIEDDAPGLLQVDFANKMIGGGVLSHGCVQEEIRFVICPELIISRLFTEKLGDTEALLITGAERFSKYKGYGHTFEWSGDFRDETPTDPATGTRRTAITAIDATYFGNPKDQFNSASYLRELNKAFAGFHSRGSGPLSPVATGNWGCGAFRGDVRLKFVIQLMACAALGRDMVYFTFGDEELRDELYNMYEFLAVNQITISRLWQLMCRFSVSGMPADDFFPYLQQAYFDLKSQPSVKTFFNKLANDTCQTDAEEPPELDSIDLESSQTSVKITKGKRPHPETDLIGILGQIDGKERLPIRETIEKNDSFLSCIDEFSRKKRQENDEQMEFEEVRNAGDADDVADVSYSGTNLAGPSVKRKITDYFNKT